MFALHKHKQKLFSKVSTNSKKQIIAHWSYQEQAIQSSSNLIIKQFKIKKKKNLVGFFLKRLYLPH